MDLFTKSIKQLLEKERKNLKQYGVDHIGYRYFLSDGRSFGCPTNDAWYATPRDHEFYTYMKSFLSDELRNLYINKFSYVSRSPDHAQNEYLQSLSQYNLAYSIGLYQFGHNRIDSFFFIYESGAGENRDLLLNNILHLEKAVTRLTKQLDRYAPYMEEKNNAEFILDLSDIKLLFQRNTHGNKQNNQRLKVHGEFIDISLREAEILYLMHCENSSNKVIAFKLGISERAIEKYLASLKHKFCANSKQHLVYMANNIPQIQNMFTCNRNYG